MTEALECPDFGPAPLPPVRGPGATPNPSFALPRSVATTALATKPITQGKQSSLEARYGPLLTPAFGILLLPARRYRKRLGLLVSEQLLVEQILCHRTDADAWPSLSQQLLADEIGASRPNVSRWLGALRAGGFVATRPDCRFGAKQRGWSTTMRYSLDPYLSALLLYVAVEANDSEIREKGLSKLERFCDRVTSEGWTWQVGDLTTKREVRTRKLREASPHEAMIAFLSATRCLQ